ncbi:MerR family transcriptional regulator [Streptomyces sp. NPDC004539]|uniref:MerR family transcriptional regulator n=1 Tax=Streptomyces sp. NPDC004539 TaxID=3154280 RepID=UPI0033BF8510
MRTAALARAAGISTQQVRNYVAAGVLPPVPRTPSGHRAFTETHLHALRTLRAMAAGHGWPTARTTLRALHTGDLPTALAALDASHAALDRERAELSAVRAALSDGALDAYEGQRALRIGEAALVVGVRPPVLRLWEERGLLRPVREPGTGYRRYPRAEVRAAQLVALLRRTHHRLDAVAPLLTALREHGDTDGLRAELALREADVHRRSLERLRASAALHAYLDAGTVPGTGLDPGLSG